MRLAIDAEPAHLNPDLDPDEWCYRLAADGIYEPLWRPRPEGGFEGVLADHFSVDDGGRRYLFHLRPGVTFHDGKPLLVTDVAFTLDRLRTQGAHAPREAALLADLDRVELAGPEAVRIWAQRPSAELDRALAEVQILPEHVFGRGELAYQGANRRPVGTGPLELASWERGAKIELRRNPRYWGPPARAEAIEVTIAADSLAALGAARRGEVDLVGRIPPAWVPEQVESASLAASYRTLRLTPFRFSFVLWNLEKPPLDDPAVRRALALAVDRAKLLAEVRHGVGRPIAAPPLPDGSAQPAPELDLARAASALAEAGLPRDGEGPRTRAGRPIRIGLLVPSSREAQETAKRLAAALAKVGVTVEPQVGDLAVLLGRMKRGQFDAALLEFSGDGPADLAPLVRARGAQNYGRYSSRAVDGLLDELRAPGADRAAVAARLSAALVDDPPALYLYAPDDVYLVARRLAPARPPSGFPLLRDLGPDGSP